MLSPVGPRRGGSNREKDLQGQDLEERREVLQLGFNVKKKYEEIEDVS